MAKKNKGKVKTVNFYRGTYATYAETKKEADSRIDVLQRKTSNVNFNLPKRIKSKTVRITQKPPRIR